MNSLQRGNKSAFQYEENRTGGALGRMDERYARAKQNGPYLVRHGITITMDDMSRAINGSEETVLYTSLVLNLVNLFRKVRCRGYGTFARNSREKQNKFSW